MADDLVSLADLATLNDMNARDLGVTDVFNDAPLLRALHAIVASNGEMHKYIKETGAPVVGFRAANTGHDRDSSQDTLVTVTLKILDASFQTDKAVADAYARGGAPALMAREAARHLRAALRHAEQQIIRGTGNEADGFSGINNELSALAHAMVIDGGGSALAGDGDRTSVYAIRSTSDEAGACVVMGHNGRIDVGEYFEQSVNTATGQMSAYVQHILAWLGLQIGGAKSIARLANVSAAASAGLNDSKMSDLYELFPEEAPPTHFAMTMGALGQLRKSRTATSATGAEAPYPQDWNGVPIITTGSIATGETAVA